SKPALAGQPDVEHEAARRIRSFGLQELLRRGEGAHFEPHRAEEVPERTAHRGVVLDDENDGPHGAHVANSPTGRENRKTAPCGSLAFTHSLPPCASTIERLIESPM